LRSTGWAELAAKAILKTPLTPNAVSVIGIGFAATGAAALLLAPGHRLWWLAAALFIQLRLLANMLDGLIAVEGGRHSPTGALFNEFPDRIEDSLLLVAAGYAAAQPALGWSAALLAMGTAYIRALGGALGHPQDFCGPMAKPHRMAALTLGAILSAVLPAQPVMAWTLGLIATGTGLTCLRRQLRLARALEVAAR
jgi:phosphatidylglycerophosphate synthase